MNNLLIETIESRLKTKLNLIEGYEYNFEYKNDIYDIILKYQVYGGYVEVESYIGDLYFQDTLNETYDKDVYDVIGEAADKIVNMIKKHINYITIQSIIEDTLEYINIDREFLEAFAARIGEIYE